MHLIGQDKTFLNLFPPGDALGQLTRGITAAVGQSFNEQNMRNPTRDEVVRRFNLCLKWAKTLRGDLEWGLDRICDELPNALGSELLGLEYKPPARQCWIPSDGG